MPEDFEKPFYRARQMSIYDQLWDFFWTPVRWLAGLILSREWFPEYGPWIVAARAGRWPHKLSDDQLSEEEREEIRALLETRPG